MAEKRSSLARSTTLKLNGGDDVDPLGRGVASRSGEAPGPVHGERGGVRCLVTDGVVENRGEHGGDGLSEVDKGAGAGEMQWGGLFL
jgi:hypothetical protein